METRQKTSLALTLIGHGAVLMILFLGAAFIHKPKQEVITMDLGLGGPKSPGPKGVPAPPAPDPGQEPPQEARPNPREAPAPKPEPEKSEFNTNKKKPELKKPVKKEKPAPPAAKPAPKKKSTAKTTVQKSNRLVTRKTSSTAKPSARPSEKGESAADIRRRMEGKIGRASGSDDATGPAGEGTGNATGTSNKFAAYLGGLEEQIQVAWEKPSSAAVGLTSEVSFFLEKTGQLTGFKITKSSGSPEMDQSALLAAKSVGIYEPWPQDFTSDLARITVVFECKPNQ